MRSKILWIPHICKLCVNLRSRAPMYEVVYDLVQTRSFFCDFFFFLIIATSPLQRVYVCIMFCFDGFVDVDAFFFRSFLFFAWRISLLGAGPQAHGGGGERAEGEGGDLQPVRVLGQDVRAHDLLLQRGAMQREEDRPRAVLLPRVWVEPVALVFCESGVGWVVGR